MKELRFEWDPAKAEANLGKHGVSFEEAASVFVDERALEFYDDEHSEWEDRFLLLGLSGNLRLLLVCHCHRVGASVVRIISARRATQGCFKIAVRGAAYPRTGGPGTWAAAALASCSGVASGLHAGRWQPRPTGGPVARLAAVS